MNRHAGFQAGHTLLEILIAAAILVQVVLVAFRAADANTTTQRLITTEAALETQVSSALTRIAERIREARSDVLDTLPTVPEHSESVSFRCMVGYDPRSGASWGPEEKIAVRKNSGGEWIHWEAGGVSERLLSVPSTVKFSRDGQLVRVEISSETEGSGGRPVRVSRSLHVYPRN